MKNGIKTLCAGLAVLGVAAGAGHATDLNQAPDAIIEQISDDLLTDLDQNREFYRQNQAALEESVRQHFLPAIDMPFASRLILGRETRNLKPAQVDEFATALSDLLIRRYAEALLDFKSRDQMKTLPLVAGQSDKMTRVRTRVRLNTGVETPVDYIFRKTPQGWMVFDVVIEGISYVTTYRNQFGEEIRRDGFDAVLERVRKGEVETDFSKDKDAGDDA